MRFRCAVSGEFLQVFAKPNDRAYPRLGLVVARKMERLAVDRNRIKRKLREAFRAQQGQLAGLDVVVRLRRPLRQTGSRLAQDAYELMAQLQRCRG
jgi:ribonuclease P protein component